MSSVGAEAMLSTRNGVLYLRPGLDGTRSVFSLADTTQPPGECFVSRV